MYSRLILRKRLEDKGLKMEDVASKGELSYSTVSNWFSGKSVTTDTLKKLAKGLDMDFAELRKLVDSDYNSLKKAAG
jgi:transcriptional regulator with XRE-family HTH domain